jgi:hypothetical protein
MLTPLAVEKGICFDRPTNSFNQDILRIFPLSKFKKAVM